MFRWKRESILPNLPFCAETKGHFSFDEWFIPSRGTRRKYKFSQFHWFPLSDDSESLLRPFNLLEAFFVYYLWDFPPRGQNGLRTNGLRAQRPLGKDPRQRCAPEKERLRGYYWRKKISIVLRKISVGWIGWCQRLEWVIKNGVDEMSNFVERYCNDLELY